MPSKPPTPSELIDARIDEYPDWRGTTLARIRELITKALPDVVEEWKWRGVPVWYQDGMLCTGEVYKSVVKVTFAKGASLDDPKGLFNSSLDGNVRRAIDFHEGETVDARDFTALVRAAAALNATPKTKAAPKKAAPKKAAPKKAAPKKAAPRATASAKPARLAGGNPQIAKGEGDAPVRAYIEAMPDWQRDVGRSIDALITRTVPEVRKAVKWSSPFYGIEGRGWFVSFHTFTKFVKVTFFQGTSLRPAPTGGNTKDARWINVGEGELDEKQLATWVKQAAKLPGWETADIRG
jgi:hypothetical protein